MSVEMMRSKDLYREPKHRRLLEQDQTPARAAPSSASPGPWLTNTIVDALLPDEKWDEFSRPTVSGEQYRNARLILESYHHIRVGPTVSEVQDDCPSFPIVNQANVLAGPELLEWRLEHRAEELKEFSAYKAKRKSRKCKKQAVVSKPPIVRITDDQLDAQYAHWFADPSPLNQAAFLEVLHHFLCGKTKLSHKDDTLRKRNESDNFQQNFLIDIVSKLTAQQADGEKLAQPSHYITRSWTNGRSNRFKEIAKEDERNPGLLQREEQAVGEQPKNIDLAAKASYDSWAIAEREVIEDQEKLRLARLSKISSLDPGLRDVVGMHLQGRRQVDIAKIVGISQPAVSRKLKQIGTLLQAMPDQLVNQ